MNLKWNFFTLAVYMSLSGIPSYAISSVDLWQRPDQRAARLLEKGQAKEAAAFFEDPQWKAVAYYRSRDYNKSATVFSALKTPDGYYNYGNTLALQGKYQDAIFAYENALKLAPAMKDAEFNRDVIKKLLKKQQQSTNNQQQQTPSFNSPTPDFSASNSERNTQQSANNKDSLASQQQAWQQQSPEDQLLRRISDEPGGLLRQKFLRDYLKRHAAS